MKCKLSACSTEEGGILVPIVEIARNISIGKQSHLCYIFCAVDVFYPGRSVPAHIVASEPSKELPLVECCSINKEAPQARNVDITVIINLNTKKNQEHNSWSHVSATFPLFSREKSKETTRGECMQWLKETTSFTLTTSSGQTFQGSPSTNLCENTSLRVMLGYESIKGSTLNQKFHLGCLCITDLDRGDRDFYKLCAQDLIGYMVSPMPVA